MRRPTVLALLALPMAGCNGDAALTEPDPVTGTIPTIVVERLDPADWKTDPVDITAATITDDALRLSVGYGGGCEPHTFALVVSRDFAERLESGQGPAAETAALIAHDAHGDLCERGVRDTLVADLQAVRDAYRDAFQTGSGAIVMMFDAGTQVRYEF